ncbi:MAG: diguanylate cyclase [Treponema sp.]|jgi:diguanylate cyclase (GGDEF)-like protein|nr:diguanylate cyclase [Treponema sp.]
METVDRCSILVIDDEKNNLLILYKILSPDYTIYTAKSGGEGLRRAAAERPDLILLDIVIPDMNGFDVLKTLKSCPNLKDIPVIIITSLDNDTDEEKCLLLGAVDYISKPFKNAIVIARVRNHIQIVQHIRMIEQLSRIDPLTGIPNRRYFNERINIEWRRAIRDKTPVSFLMIDVDKFKNYNDTYGHPNGDALLQVISKIFISAARRPSDAAVRLGGEEFGILLPETPAKAASIIAERVREKVEAARIPLTDGRLTSATISIGVVTMIPAKQSRQSGIEDFIAQADANLYAAKNTGRNRVCSGYVHKPGSEKTRNVI